MPQRPTGLFSSSFRNEAQVETEPAPDRSEAVKSFVREHPGAVPDGEMGVEDTRTLRREGGEEVFPEIERRVNEQQRKRLSGELKQAKESVAKEEAASGLFRSSFSPNNVKQDSPRPVKPVRERFSDFAARQNARSVAFKLWSAEEGLRRVGVPALQWLESALLRARPEEFTGFGARHIAEGQMRLQTGPTPSQQAASIAEGARRAGEVAEGLFAHTAPLDATVGFPEEMEASVASGMRGVLQGVNAYMAKVAHGDGNTEKFNEYMDKWRRHQRAVERYNLPHRTIEDVAGPSDFFAWAAQGLATQTPIVGQFVAASTAGGAVGGKIGAPFGPKGGAIGLIAGSLIGGLSVGQVAYSGDIFAQLVEDGVEPDEAASIADRYGFGAAAASIIVPSGLGAIFGRALIRPIAGSATARLAGRKLANEGATKATAAAGMSTRQVVAANRSELKRRLMREVPLWTGGAITAEGVGEAIAEWFVTTAWEEGTGQQMDPDQKRSRILNAGAIGALMGGPMGTVGGFTQSLTENRREMVRQIEEHLDRLMEGVTEGLTAQEAAEAREYIHNATSETIEELEALVRERAEQHLEETAEEAPQEAVEAVSEAERVDTAEQTVEATEAPVEATEAPVEATEEVSPETAPAPQHTDEVVQNLVTEAPPPPPEVSREPQHSRPMPPEPDPNSPGLVDVPVQREDPRNILLDPPRFQFKQNVDEKGIQKRLEGPWVSTSAGVLLVWQNMAGETYVVNGHHRLQHALDKGVEVVNVQVLREVDGYTERDAMRIAAEDNIRGGGGTIFDHANFFRSFDEYQDADVAGARGIRGAGFKIGRWATEATYQEFINEKITPQQAEAIAETSPNDSERQNVALWYLNERPRARPDEIRGFLNSIRVIRGGQEISTQQDMFGDNMVLQQAEALGKAVASLKKKTQEALTAVRTPFRRKEVARREGVEFTRTDEEIEQEIQRLRERLWQLDLYYLYPDLRQEVVDEAGLTSDIFIQEEEMVNASQEDIAAAEETAPDLFASSALPATNRWSHDARSPRPPMPRIQPSPISGGTPKSPVLTILDFTKWIKHPLRTAKTRPGTLGNFFPATGRAVIRFTGDINTAAHELAHVLDWQFRIMEPWALEETSPYDAELIPFFSAHGSPPPKNLSESQARIYERAEGVAEWIRGYIVNPEAAKALAPRFYRHLKDTVPQDAFDAIDAFSRQVRENIGAPATDQIVAHVDMEARGIGDRMIEGVFTSQTIRDRAASLFWNSMHPLLKATEYAMKLKGIERIAPAENPYMLARLFSGVVDKALDILEYGPIDFTNQERVEEIGGVAELFAPFVHSDNPHRTMERTVAYMLAERTLVEAERIDEQMARDLSDMVEGRLRKAFSEGEITEQELQNSLEALREVRNIEEMVELGFLDPLEDQSLIERKMEEADNRKRNIAGFSGRLFSDVETAQQAIDELRRDQRELSIIQEGARRYRAFADQVLRYAVEAGRVSEDAYNEIRSRGDYYIAMNRVLDRIAPAYTHASNRLAAAAPVVVRFRGSTEIIRNPYISLAMQVLGFTKEADRNNIKRTLLDLVRAEKGLYEGSPVFLAGIAAEVMAPSDRTITVYENGEPRYIELEPGLYRAFQGLDDKTADHVFLRAVQVMPRVLHASIVHTPAFVSRSTMRDMFHRPIVSRTGAMLGDAFFWLTPKGRAEYAQQLSDFHRLGGGLFGHYPTTERQYLRRMKEAMEEVTGAKGTHIITTAGQIARGYLNIAKRAEEMGRVTEFRRARNYAKNVLKYDDLNAGLYAAYQARDITDYAMGGSVMRELNKYIPFTNAATQGLYKTIRTARENPMGLAARWFLVAGMPSFAAYAWNKSRGADEEWAQFPDHVRDYFWSFKVTENTWVHIPRPWELGVASAAIDRMMIQAAGLHSNPWEGFGKSMLNITAPVNETLVVAPFQGIAETMANWSFFRKRPIIDRFDADLDLELRQRTTSASRVGQLLQEAVGMDARRWDHLIRSQFGMAGSLGMSLSDIGREDKRVNIGRALTGVTGAPPEYFSRDVQWVFERARSTGQLQRSDIRELSDLANRYFEEQDTKEIRRLGTQLREKATQIRGTFDQDTDSYREERRYNRIVRNARVFTRPPSDSYRDVQQWTQRAAEAIREFEEDGVSLVQARLVLERDLRNQGREMTPAMRDAWDEAVRRARRQGLID